ncbi:KTSC domain-containing protein [Sphingomonas mesophila]|uniref:KTSC domain-containing protein n=1 Tax=Sphingomonas mesophila TaxID=2303576 RepID=UPI000E58D431|nr:KTSC domain-containing protein [Sphingomonas mesophila]
MPSAVIRRFAYHHETSALEVTFTTGRRYLYANVPPEAAEALAAAFAKGIHFNRHIRGRYAFEELEAEAPRPGSGQTPRPGSGQAPRPGSGQAP